MAIDSRTASQDEPAPPPQPAAAAGNGRLAALRRLFTDYLDSREPGLPATLLAALGVMILLGLGSWQMLRLAEKNTLLQSMAEELRHHPADLRRTPPATPSGWRELHYRPVFLKGGWLTLHAIKLAPRTYEGQAGYQLLVPLLLDGGKVVLVDRGFVAQGAAVIPQEEGMAQIKGIARIPESEKPSSFVPENRPDSGEWVWIDLEAMGRAIGMGRLAPVVVYEDRIADRDTYPIGGQLPLPAQNNHRQYAATWFGMALALIGVWLAASGPRPNSRPGKEEKTAPPEDLSDPVARRGRYPEATD